MKVKRIAPQPEPATHLLAVTQREMKALRRACEAYVQDEHRERSPYYKPDLQDIMIELGKALDL